MYTEVWDYVFVDSKPLYAIYDILENCARIGFTSYTSGSLFVYDIAILAL